MAERWKDIYGYKYHYQVSNNGRIRSISRIVKTGKGWRIVPNIILKPAINNKGYYFVTLWKNNKSKGMTIHRMVAKAFKKNPKRLPQVNHFRRE